MTKLARDYATYELAKPGGERCDGCKWFRGGACELVEGKIAAGGWCRFHHAARRRRMPPNLPAHVREMRRRMPLDREQAR